MLEAINTFQKAIQSISQLPFAPKLIISLLLILITVLLLMLIWSKPKLKMMGSINVFIWSSQDNARRAIMFTDPTALPLRKGDQIRIEAEVSIPSYLYIVWVGTEGTAHPVYPWEPGKWESLPQREKRVRKVSLPHQADVGWPLKGPPGMETLILLVRFKPLPRSFDLKKAFAGFPSQPFQNDRSVVWLDGGEISKRVERTPQFFNPEKINDPVLITQRLITERLKSHFPLIRAVSFASSVDEIQ